MAGFQITPMPDPDDPGAAEVLVSAQVGDRTYTFLLDTGAGRSSVQFDEYTATFPVAGQHASSGVFARHQEELISVPHLALGPIARQDFSMVRMAANAPTRRNLMGMDFLHTHSFHFSFSQNWVEVDPEMEAGQAPHDLLLGKKHHPYVEVRFGGQAARAVWDTGAGITVVDQGLVERLPDHFQADGVSVGTDSTGASMETPMYRMSGAVIGGLAFSPHRVAAVDLSPLKASTDTPMELILGYTTLSQADWLFDFPRRRWGITGMNAGLRQSGPGR